MEPENDLKVVELNFHGQVAFPLCPARRALNGAALTGTTARTG